VYEVFGDDRRLRALKVNWSPLDLAASYLVGQTELSLCNGETGSLPMINRSGVGVGQQTLAQ
jgi:hypothetical protein